MAQAPDLTLPRPVAPGPTTLVMLVLGAADRSGLLQTLPGDPAANVRAGADPLSQGIHFATVRQLGPQLLAAIRPQLVLSTLIDSRNDAIEIATRLQELGFQGRYRALATKLPQPDIVIREVRAMAPGIDFDLFLLTSPLRQLLERRGLTIRLPPQTSRSD